MTATLTTVPSTTAPPTTAERIPSLTKAGLVAGVVAATATTAIAVVAKAQGVAVLTQPGNAIPLAAFAQLTLVFTGIGILLASALRRRASRPRRRLRTTTIALTALSFLPDLLLSTDAASKATLMASHVVAAAIVIPVLLARVPEVQGSTAS